MRAEHTVFVVDDDLDARDSIKALVTSKNGQCRIFEAGADFLASYDPSQRGCLVTDYRMPGMNGRELQLEIKRREWTIPIVLISGYVDVSETVEVMRDGAEYVVAKPYRHQELWNAIEAALVRDDEIRAKQAHRREVVARFASLTPDERQVLVMIADGLPNKTVAKRMDVSMRTIEERRRRIMDKAQVATFAALLALYTEWQALERERQIG